MTQLQKDYEALVPSSTRPMGVLLQELAIKYNMTVIELLDLIDL